MDWFPFNVADIVALLFVVALVALAVRGIRRGGALDCSSCNGDCGGCGGTCVNPQLKLSKEQLAELDELTEKYENVGETPIQDNCLTHT